MKEMRHKKAHLVGTNQLEKNGRFVRAPASDRVKIPKGQKVFLTVSERNHRKDGNPDNDLYSSPQYQLVYVPPNFRARVFLFILFIWLFAAVTGVSFTIAPLVLGRTMFKMLLPAYIRTNDIYAFSIGIYILGTLSYAIFRLRQLTARFWDMTYRIGNEIAIGNGSNRTISGLARGAQLFYAYFFLAIVFPLAVSTMMELYISIPLHTYLNPPVQEQIRDPASGQDGAAGRHNIRVIQSWTLGLLYLNLATRMITSLFPDTRAAMAVRSVMRRGYLKPDVHVLTRAFIVPGVALSILAIFGPPLSASLLMNSGMLPPTQFLGGAVAAGNTAKLSLVYRYSYPAAAVAAAMIKYMVGLTWVFNRWTAGVRDEAYLIGERLHNFGAATAGSRKARSAWGAAGGGRL
jgi:E3 ubiquitin-protein ligase MARCH6